MTRRALRAPRDRVSRAGRARQRGQAIIETAIVVIFAMTLFVGVYATAVAISDSNTAGQAVRSGVRFGAQVGNNNYTAGTTDACQGGTQANPCGVDLQIVAGVAAGVKSLPYATLTRIVIYQPTTGSSSAECVNGTIASSPYDGSELGEIYTPTAGGGFTESNAPGGAYTLDLRSGIHPHERAIAVQLDFTYKSPTPLVSVSISHREFAVNCLAPKSS